MLRWLLPIMIISFTLPIFMQSDAKASRHYGLKLCDNAHYKCVRVRRGQTWESMFPNQEKRDLVQRLNRKNTALISGMRLAVPRDFFKRHHMHHAPFVYAIEPMKHRMILIDPKLHAWGAYNRRGQLVHWGPAALGKTWCADVGRGCRTIRGEFTIYSRQGAGCRSHKYPLRKGGGAPMPYCMHFYKGFAIHGSPTVPGYHASHGCVRIFPRDAKWLNQEFIQIGSTKVLVKNYK